MHENDAANQAGFTLVSPNELQEKAIEIMLEGRPPETHEDWAKCVNFWAANTAVPPSALMLVAKLFGCPLGPVDIGLIAIYQQALRHGATPVEARMRVESTKVELVLAMLTGEL